LVWLSDFNHDYIHIK